MEPVNQYLVMVGIRRNQSAISFEDIVKYNNRHCLPAGIIAFIYLQRNEGAVTKLLQQILMKIVYNHFHRHPRNK